MVNGDFSGSLRQLVADYDRRINDAQKELQRLQELRKAAMLLLEHESPKTKDAPSPSSEKPYAGMSAIQAAEMVLRKHSNKPLHADTITKELIDGGWFTEAAQPKQSVVGAMFRNKKFENLGGNKYRLKITEEKSGASK
jgi:hypothetical protein